jgi:hypothetical protein
MTRNYEDQPTEIKREEKVKGKERSQTKKTIKKKRETTRNEEGPGETVRRGLLFEPSRVASVPL